MRNKLISHNRHDDFLLTFLCIFLLIRRDFLFLLPSTLTSLMEQSLSLSLKTKERCWGRRCTWVDFSLLWELWGNFRQFLILILSFEVNRKLGTRSKQVLWKIWYKPDHSDQINSWNIYQLQCLHQFKINR